MSHGGKGDKARPFSVDKETFDNHWDVIFNKKLEELKKGPDPTIRDDARAEDEAFADIARKQT